MPLTAARAVAVVLVTYAVSSAVFVDGLPAPSEEDGAIALLAAEEGTGAGFANFGEGLTGADGIDPNMVDIGKVFAHHPGADARAPRASRRGNPLQRFASGEMVKIVRRAANVKVKMAREKEHKAQAQVVEMQKSIKQSEAATAKAKASAAAAQQKAEQSALDAKKFHDDASAIALKQAAVEHAPARSLPAKRLRMLAATKKEQAVEPELTANKLASTSTRISTLLRHEAAQKSAERKAQNVAADAKEGRDKALEKASLPRLQGAAVVPTTFKSDGSAPPADGITEATAVANPEMQRQDRAAAEAEEEIRADELGEARPVTKRLRKATKLPKGTGPGQTKDQQSRKPVSCFRAGKCDPEACLCKLGQNPVPWVQLRKQNMAHSERKKGDASCIKAGTDECDPEACLCRQDGNHVPLSKAKVATAGKKGDASCIKAGTDECDPEACLCRHGQPPVPRHTLHKKQHPRLGAEGPSGHIDPNLKKGYYERMPNLQGHKPVLPEAEQFADQAVEKFVHWDHPDKFQKQEQKQAEGAIATEHKIYNKLKQMGDAQDAARKWEKAGIAEFKAHNVTEERADADKAWKDRGLMATLAQAIPGIAGKNWERDRVRFPKIKIGPDGQPEMPRMSGPKPNMERDDNSEETDAEAAARQAALRKESKMNYHASRASRGISSSGTKKDSTGLPTLKSKPGETAEAHHARQVKLDMKQRGIDFHKYAEKAKQSPKLSTLETLISVEESNLNPSVTIAEESAANDLSKTVRKAKAYVAAAQKLAARQGAEVGIATAHEESRLALQRQATRAESQAMRVESETADAIYKKKSRQLAEREMKLKEKQGELRGEAKAQKEIFNVQQVSESKLAEEVKSATKLTKLQKMQMKLAKRKAALDAEASTQNAIFQKQLKNSDSLKAEVQIVGKAEKGALANAVKLGEVKAHAEDQAHIILNAQKQRQKHHDDALTSKWTMKHTAALGKLMVITNEVDQQLAKKKASLSKLSGTLKALHKKLSRVVEGEEHVQRDDSSILESTEEMSREELGESHDELGESGDLGESDEDLGDTLAQMSSQFASIQKSMDEANKEAEKLQADTASKKAANEKQLKKHVAKKITKKNKENKKMEIKKMATKKQLRLEQKLEKEEARLRMTTKSKVRAQYRLENAVDHERAHKSKLVAKMRTAPTSRLTPQMETRLEYQRMYVQNEMQQAQQARSDLQNKLDNIKNDDASKLQELTDRIREKHELLSRDIKTVQTLTDEYQRDHEIGESISSENGAGPLAAHSRRQEARDIKDESDIADKSHDISRELSLMHANDQHRLVESAQEILGLSKKNLGEGQEVTATDTDGISGVALGKEQIKLAGRISVAKTGLKLKLDKLANMQKQEQLLIRQSHHLHRAAVNAREGEYDAQTRTAALQKQVGHLSRAIGRHEESMELGETLFRREENEMEEGDLGESSSSNSNDSGLPPIQQEINYEHEKMAEAEAEIRHLAKYGPKIVKEQIQVDKQKYGAVLKKENHKLDLLHKRFAHAAALLSPRIKSQKALDDAEGAEEGHQQDYAHDLDNIGQYAQMVDVKAKQAEDAARALDDDEPIAKKAGPSNLK